MKKGSQQRRKAPITTPRVTNALCSFKADWGGGVEVEVELEAQVEVFIVVKVEVLLGVEVGVLLRVQVEDAKAVEVLLRVQVHIHQCRWMSDIVSFVCGLRRWRWK